MAGILASSATTTMVSGDTAADNVFAGYVTNESIALSTTPTGSSYVWNLSKPVGSTARATLSSDDTATSSFVPDVAGYYVITCTVSGTTTYILRVSVTQVAQTTSYEAIRFQPKLNAAVPVPGLGGALFWSLDSDEPCFKRPDGSVAVIAEVTGDFGALDILTTGQLKFDTVESFSGSITTSDDTTTTIDTYTPSANGVFLVCVLFTAIDENNDAAMFIRSAAFKRVAGTLSQVSTTDSPFTKRDSAAAGIQAVIDASGGAIRCRGTGQTSLDVEWKAMGQVAYLLT